MNYRNEIIEKILEYVTAALLLLFFAGLFSQLILKSKFFPAWLVLILFFFSMISLYAFLKVKYGQIEKPETPPILDSGVEEIEVPHESFDEIWRREKEAHELIVRLCESKNIRLTLKQHGSSGHCEIPEIWTMERAVPLTPDDLYALTAKETVHAETKLHDDGILYVEKFWRNGSWTIYETEKPARKS